MRLLERRGASFTVEIARGVGASVPAAEEALRKLALRSLVTNDRFEVARHLAGETGETRVRTRETLLLTPLRGAGSGRGGFTRAALREAKRRARLRAAQAVSTAPAQGRWSLSSPRTEAEPEARAEHWARLLLRRYGVVAREWLAHEPLLPDAHSVWTALRRMEIRGEIRGGYFVAGLTGVQFALPEAVEALREAHDELGQAEDSLPVVLNALDPACVPLHSCPPGNELRAGEIQRRASTWVVLGAGRPILVAHDSGRRLFTDLPKDHPLLETALRMLLQHLARTRRRVSVEMWNGLPVLESDGLEVLRSLGFFREPKRVTWERPPR